MKRVNLNLDKETCRTFVDFLANEGYWGNTETHFDIAHGAEEVIFVINGHELSNVSNQMQQVVIDKRYTYASRAIKTEENGTEYTALDYCLKRLGF